jgi:hypothetical protein
MPVIPPTLRRLASSAGNPLANPVSGCEANDQSDYTGGHCCAPPLRSRLGACIRRTFSGRTRSKLQWSQQRPSLTGCALLPKPTIAPPQIEQTCTGVIVRAQWCAHGQAQQRSGRPGLSNTKPAPRSPPQAKASAIRSWPASDELADARAIKRTSGAGVSLQFVKGLAMSRTIKHMNPPAAVPHITGADT